MKKVCICCLVEKPLTEFYRHAGMADGRLGKCKACQKENSQQNYRKNRESRAAYERGREADPYRKAQKSKTRQRYEKANPDKCRARQATKRAVKNGVLVKTPCACGSNDRVQAHHRDYSRPLDVVWMCFRCHRAEHGQETAASNR